MRIRIYFAFILLLLYFLSPASMAQREDWNQLNIPDSPDPRKGHSLVTLPDGRVVMFGGEGPQVELFNNLFVFEDNQWAEIEPLNDPPPARSFHKSWVIDNDMYVFGGKGNGTVFNDIWVFDFVNNLWEEEVVTGDMPPGRYGHSATLLSNESVFLFGGKNENDERLKDAWLFENGGFVQKSDCFLDYAHHNGHGFINNGVQLLRFYGISNILMTYEADLESWELSALDMPYSGHGSSVLSQNFLDEDVVSIFGGTDISGDPTDIVYQYNCNTGEIVQREEPLPGAVKDNAAAKYYYGNAADDNMHSEMYEILLFGGEIDGVLSNATWMSTSNLLNIQDFPADHPSMRIIPNPASNYVKISSEQKIDRIRIFNVHGSLLQTLEVFDNELLLQNTLPGNGIYLLFIETKKETICKKLIISH